MIQNVERLFHMPVALWSGAGAAGSVIAISRSGSGVAVIEFATASSERRVKFVELMASSFSKLEQDSALEVLAACECPISAANNLKHFVDPEGL